MGSLNVPIGDPEWSRSHVPTQDPGGRSFLTAVERAKIQTGLHVAPSSAFNSEFGSEILSVRGPLVSAACSHWLTLSEGACGKVALYFNSRGRRELSW